MQIDIITREYPPYVYGGAGVHVTELSKALKKATDINVRIRCFEGPRKDPGVFGYMQQADNLNGVFQAIDIDNQIANEIKQTDLVHSHTWYANLAGFLVSKNLGVPHVATAHSLEPLRPWKAEQLGGGYVISSFIEKTAYQTADAIIAVSQAMKKDILRCYPEIDSSKVFVVLNGIDINKFKQLSIDKYSEIKTDLEKKYKIKPDVPTAVFVGRITRQKGLPYLMKALLKVPKDIQVILCAGAPDTKEIAREVQTLYKDLESKRGNVVMISDMLSLDNLKCVLQMSDVFLCPSIYEPLGIVNLEAMALSLPVVATKTGGIPEVVLDKQTGILVDIEQKAITGEPVNPNNFVNDFAEAINKMFSNLSRAKKYGQAGRIRVENSFTWNKIALETKKVYKKVL
ncbi:MAG: glycogen synthase [Bifidobacteriaceae bacterium]|jgi:starch synthase|nr:glycogen synthase [Bifidobacteriaceae bacterium]